MESQSQRDKHDEFLRLFSRYSQRIYSFIFTLVMGHADADEIFQETCVVLWKKFDSYDEDGSFLSWACQIALLEVKQLRRRGHRLQVLTDEALAAIADHAVTQSGQYDIRQEALEHCLEKLAEEDYVLIEQRYRQQRTPKEIAALTSRSVHSVYRALTRIHNLLLGCVSSQLAEKG